MDVEAIDLEARPDAELAVIAGHLNAQHARAVQVVAEALHYGTWQGAGIASPEQWLRLRLGCSRRTARSLVTVAGRAEQFPVTLTEFAAGGLSLDQVEVIVTRAPAWADARMAGFAGALTVHQLQRVIRDEFFDGPAEPDPAATDDAGDETPPPPTVESTDRFTYGWTELGRFAGSFDVGSEYGKVLEALFDKISNDCHEASGERVSGSDVLLETVARAATNPTGELLATGWGNGSRLGDSLGRFRTFLHLEIGHDAKHLLARFSNGMPLADSIRQYLTCDGEITPVWERDHVPVGYGRAQRTVPTKMRRLVQRRDRGCRVPGCDSKFIEVHHIVHWEHHGPTDTWNLISLCSRHHHLLHLGQIRISGNADRADSLQITDAAGHQIRGPSPVKPDAPPEPVAPYDPPCGGRMDLTRFSGWVHPDVAEQRWRKAAAHQARQADENRRLSELWRQLGQPW